MIYSDDIQKLEIDLEALDVVYMSKAPESKTVIPNDEQQIITASEMHELAKVIVEKVPIESVKVKPMVEDQTILPKQGKYFDKVEVEKIHTEQTVLSPTNQTQVVKPTEGKFFDEVTINPIATESITITPTEETQTHIPPSPKYYDKVVVNPIPDDYSKPEGTLDITKDGTYNIQDYKFVNVVQNGVAKYHLKQEMLANDECVLVFESNSDDWDDNYYITDIKDGNEMSLSALSPYLIKKGGN